MPLPPNASPLLVLAIVLLTGAAVGWVARRFHLPSITGQIAAGIMLGPGLHLIDPASLDALRPLTHFALALMAVTVGSHMNVRRLRNAGSRLLLLLLFEATITPAIVILAVVVSPAVDWSGGLLFGALAISTAPATILALVRETRSRGVFVKTLIAAVALNNMACILLFEIARAIAHVRLGGSDQDLSHELAGPARQLVTALLLGGAAAIAMEVFARVFVRRDRLATSAFVAVLLVSGLASAVDASPLLAALFLGVIQANVTRERERFVDALFSDFWPAILVVFFTLAGMELNVGHAKEVGLVAALFVTARAAGKLVSTSLAMRLAGATEKLRKYLGLALMPQAGVAIGLVILLEDDPVFREGPGHDLMPLFVGVVLSAVMISEIVGPLLTRFALIRSGEVGRDRLRLIDFIQEENIVIGLSAQTMEDAIEQLTDVLLTSHDLPPEDKEPLLRSILEREAEVSTCLGGGLAVPHGILPRGSKMLGVMGLSRKGLPFPTPDGEPVRCVVLLATPDNERDRHLQVLAALARTFGGDTELREQLLNAKSAAHAFDALDAEGTESLNELTDESDVETPPA